MVRRKASDEVFEEDDKVPRNAANERERTRMRVLSKAFGQLKLRLPWVPPDTKLSKLDTLRLAMSYINHMQKTLEEDDNNVAEKKEMTVTVKNKKKCWPYNHPSVSTVASHNYFMREEQNLMRRVEEDIRERVREDNNIVNILYCGEGMVRGKEGLEKTNSDENFVEESGSWQ